MFYKEVELFIKFFLKKNKISTEEPLINDLLSLQREAVAHYDDDGDVDLKLNYNLPKYIEQIKAGLPAQLINHKSPKKYKIEKRHKGLGKKEDFAREVVWYGRKGGKFLSL